MSKKLMLGVGLESIKFQSGIFFKELAILFRAIRDSSLPEDVIDKSDEVKAISACIKYHTNLNTKIIVDYAGPAVTIPHVNKNHPFIDEFYRNYFSDADVYSAMKRAKGIVKGGVDLESGVVSGIFTEIESTIVMPIEWLLNEKIATVEELAAVTLHEVGHLFTYYEYISRTTTTNQVLAALHRGYAEADTIDKRTALLIHAKKALSLKEEGIEELAKSNKAEVVTTVIITNIVEKTRAELGANIYDMNSWEYLADEFATRHQAGRHLITAFDKIYRKSGHMSFRGTGKYAAFEALKLSFLVLGMITLPISGIPAYMSLVSIMYGLSMAASDSDTVTYDEPEARMRRVRQQIVENLKDRKLDKDIVISLNEDIKTIDTILENVKDKRQLIGILYDAISPTGRKNRNDVVLQQQLETLANNNLFVKASEFKTIAA